MQQPWIVRSAFADGVPRCLPYTHVPDLIDSAAGIAATSHHQP